MRVGVAAAQDVDDVAHGGAVERCDDAELLLPFREVL
jgi:hypothetical protein